MKAFAFVFFLGKVVRGNALMDGSFFFCRKIMSRDQKQ
jgi:hypothetical protein